MKKVNEIIFKLTLIFIGIAAIVGILIVKSKSHSDVDYLSPLFIYTIAITTFQLSRLSAAILYNKQKKTVIPKHNLFNQFNYEPSVSFVIPCKNEQEVIGNTVEKCFQADYPKEKIEVIVINDGSTDNTIGVLEKCKNKYPNLKIIDWKINRGKRHGMAAGFKIAKGEIVIQLDSDSYIEPLGIRNLVAPFENPKIGAVCAHADPQNADANWLTKTQAAYYFMSFRILKAAESSFLKVFCCSGCSSAYRKSIVLPILDLWLEEKFLGLPVTWGDDRALTNWVLRQDYETIYTDTVQAFTVVPEKFKTFLKQQVRWKKGWMVNSLFALKFIIKKDPFVSFTYFIPLVIITLITPFMAMKAMIINPIFRGILPIYYISGIFLVAVVMTSYYRFIARENKYWPYMFVWSGINMIFLSYILLYAIATIQNRKWGTR